jgi:hypothetical protein
MVCPMQNAPLKGRFALFLAEAVETIRHNQ